MGPLIILDKSALQALSLREIYTLGRHFNLVVPPILLVEILGDLKKGVKDGGLAREEVSDLAGKLLSGGYGPPYYPLMVIQDLCAGNVPMTGQVPQVGGRETESPNGSKGVFFDVTPENQAILRWMDGHFDEAEIALGARWRESTKALDLEGFRRERRLAQSWRGFKNIDNLHRYVRWIISSTETAKREAILRTVIDAFRAPPSAQQLIFHRWRMMGFPALDSFAPYAYHCFCVDLVFHYGVITGLITTKASNRVDMEYFYYAPFCHVFCSRDKLHQTAASTFLRINQSYVAGDELKADLVRLNQWWEGMSEEQQRDRDYAHGHYPPEDRTSVTWNLWAKHLMPWRPGSGNRVAKMSVAERMAERETLRREFGF